MEKKGQSRYGLFVHRGDGRYVWDERIGKVYYRESAAQQAADKMNARGEHGGNVVVRSESWTQHYPRRNGRVATAYRPAGVRIAKVSVRGRRATRKRNPVPRGRGLGERSFTLSTLRAVKQGGRAERIWYEDARDGKHYYHDFDGAQGAVMYLCESAAVGKCILIVSGDLATPLWEDA